MFGIQNARYECFPPRTCMDFNILPCLPDEPSPSEPPPHSDDNFFGISSKSSALSRSITRPASLVFRISSLAPAYSIRSSLLQVVGM